MAAAKTGKAIFQWTADLEEQVLDAHASGRTLLDICGPDAPLDAAGTQLTYQMVCAHERADKEFREQISLAIDQFCRVKFDECLKISQDSSGDWRQRLTKGGETVAELNLESIARSKLQIDTIMKMLPKIRPATYGDPKKGPAVAVQVNAGANGIDPKTVQPLDAARRVAFLLAAGQRKVVNGVTAPTLASSVVSVQVADDDEL